MKENYTFELYHENSKLRRGDIELYTWIGLVNAEPAIRNILSNPVLTYGNSDEIILPAVDINESPPFFQIQAGRRSKREFKNVPCTTAQLSVLLKCSIAENTETAYDDGVKWNFRPYPSGGGLYPIDTYVVAYNVVHLERGIYHYNPRKHTLSELNNHYSLEQLEVAMPTLKKEIASCSFLIILSSEMSKMSFKYQERAYRFALLECGHISQNLLLCATALDIKSFPVGAFLDDEVNSVLNLDGVTSNVQYINFFGM
jgi:SagB-type dehydrogenase family enzyme